MLIRSSILGLLLAVAAFSQPAAPQGDPTDTEDANHGVARISLTNGDVSVRRGDSGDFVAANVNAPLMGADSIQTGAASRAEVQFDDATRIRLSAFAEVRLGDLRLGHFQIQVARGTTTFTLARDTQAQIEISTPSASIRPLHRGDYRVEVMDDGTTQITMRGGDADIFTPQGSQRIPNGQTMMVRGSGNESEYQLIGAIPQDDWDQFNERRDRELEHSTAYQHVSRDVNGAEDLDQYGKWNQDPEYGQVWTPRVSNDWAPYQSGRWVWEDYYGWTWVSYDPWGWAPYHYGRWFHGGLGWSWYPGPIGVRAFYRPALVGFFGFGGGSGFGFGFGFGSIGWVPLGPFEAFHSWWGRGSGRGFANANIYNTYRNARVFNGVSGASAQQFQSGQFGRLSHPTAGQLANGSAIHGQLPITPGNANLRFNDRQTGSSARTAASQTRFVSRGGFLPLQRTSFEQQRQSFQQNFNSPRSSVGNSQSQSRGSEGIGRPAGSSSQQPNSSWQHFGTTAGGTAGSSIRTGSQTAGTPASSNSWGHFGSPASTGSSAVRGSSFAPSTRSVQISPPIVQQRSGAPRQSAPASSSHQSSPAPTRSTSSSGSRPSGGSSSSHAPSGGSSHHGR